jgi:hypothetical protein
VQRARRAAHGLGAAIEEALQLGLSYSDTNWMIPVSHVFGKPDHNLDDGL